MPTKRQLIDQIRAARNRAQYDAGGEVDAERAIELAVRAVVAVRAVFT